MVLIARFISIVSRKLFEKQQNKIGAINGFTEEAVNGQNVIKVFCHEKQTLNDLAISYKSAEYELQNLNNFDENKDDNFYFRQYKKLTDYLRGAISTAQKDKMVIDRDFLFSQYGAGLDELYKDQLNKLQEDMTTLEQECIQGQEMQK